MGPTGGVRVEISAYDLKMAFRAFCEHALHITDPLEIGAKWLTFYGVLKQQDTMRLLIQANKQSVKPPPISENG